MTFQARLIDAYRRAREAGHNPISAGVNPEDWKQIGVPPVRLDLARNAPVSVLWAASSDGTRRIPYPLT